MIQVTKRSRVEYGAPKPKRVCYENGGGRGANICHGKPSIALIPDEDDGQSDTICHGRPGIASTPEHSGQEGESISDGKSSVASFLMVTTPSEDIGEARKSKSFSESTREPGLKSSVRTEQTSSLGLPNQDKKDIDN